MEKKPRVNNEIRPGKLRVVGENEENLGILERDEALARAKESGLDLILVTEKADPPVARIGDFGKYLYRLQKKEKRSRLSKATEQKNVQIRVKTGGHDLDTKAKQVEKFLEKGYIVRTHIYLRGREKAHTDLAREKLVTFLTMISTPHRVVEEIKKIPTGFSAIIAKQ